MVQNESILVTGGAGFIGSRLVARLADGNRVRVLDTLHRDALSRTGLDRHPNVELVRGDVCNESDVRAAVEGVDRILHLASTAGVATVRNNPVRTMRVVIEGTRNILDAAVRRGTVRRVVSFSTSEVYGRFAYNVAEADPTPIEPVAEPRWTYAVAKIAAEHLAYSYFREHGLPVCSVRPFNIYGPGQVGEGAIHHFIRAAIANETIRVHNDGQQIRSWCYVDDMVDATLAALESDSAPGQVFNVGSPRETLTVLALAELVIQFTGSRSPVVHVTPDFPDVEVRVPRIDKARSLLGFQPKVRLSEGLDRTIHWYRQETK